MAISRFQLELASLRELPPNEVDGFADSSPIVLAYLGRQDYLCVYQNLSRVYIFLTFILNLFYIMWNFIS
jgi:hypothetical protein